MKAMVLAAGMGMRMGGLTLDRPKPMLEVNGTPILGHIFRNLSKHGFDDVAVNLHHHPEAIRDFFGDGIRWGVRIRYFPESTLLGTAGGVKNAEEFFEGESVFLVHYGDIVTDQSLSAMLAFHRVRDAEATLLLHERAKSNSVVEMGAERRILRLWERPSAEDEARLRARSSWVNSGIYLFGPSFFAGVSPCAPSDIPRDVLPAMIARGRVFGFPLVGYRCAVDSPERLAKVREDLCSLGRTANT